MKKLLLSTFIFLSSFNLFAQVSKSLVYEISGNGLEKSSYLFGTFHLLGSNYIEQKERVNQLYKNADHIVVETIIDSSQLMAVTLKAMMPGKSLKKLVKEDDYQLLAKEIKENIGQDIALFDQFKPAYIATSLSLVYLNKQNPWIKEYGGTPMDLYFAQKAKEKNIPVHTFETMMEQVDILFGSKPVEEQAKELVEMVREKQKVVDMTKSIGKNYLAEDLPALLKAGDEYSDEFADMTELVDKRNINWMMKIPELLKKGNVFIAVGALHLPGKNGLIELLIKQGYTVKPI